MVVKKQKFAKMSKITNQNRQTILAILMDVFY